MLPAMELSGTAAIISGGASGLGEAAARELAAAGSTVVIADLNEERGKKVADEIGGEFVKTDVSDEASVAAAVAVAAGREAPLRTVVNCAGIGWAERTVNREGAPHNLATFRKVHRHQPDRHVQPDADRRRRRSPRPSRSTPTGSAAWSSTPRPSPGIEGQTGQLAYSASKGGIIGMTVPAARDLAAIGVRVNTICPGIIDTPIYGTGPGQRGVQGQARRAGRLPQADGHGGGVRRTWSGR